MSEESTAVVTVEAQDLIPQMAITPESYLKIIEQRQRFIKLVFQDGYHYGKVGDLPKPMVFKPGVEALLEFYGMGARFELIERTQDWEHGFFYYLIRCVVFDKRNGNVVCHGLGACNSRETRYAGRWVFANEIPEGVDKDKLKSREYERRDGSGSFLKYWVANDSLADLDNTILKMALTRALRDGGLRATRSSGDFAEMANDWVEMDYQPKKDERKATSRGAKPIPTKPPAEPNFGRYIHPRNKPPRIPDPLWEEWSSLVDVAGTCKITIPGFPQNDPNALKVQLDWLKGEINKKMAEPPAGVDADGVITEGQPAAQGRLV